MIVLLTFAFLSGLVTILAPCIWPLLPIILSSSVAGKETGHARPFGIVLGIMLSFAVFTLTLSTLVRAFHFDANILRYFAVVVIGVLGFAMIVPGFNRILELGISRLSSKFGQTGQNSKAGFGAGFVTGASLGLVWSPCAGPILAGVAALAATGKVSGTVVLVTIAYVIGVGIPLFLFAILGRQLFTKTKVVNKHLGIIQQFFGLIMIATAILILTNQDKVLQTKLLDAFPSLSQSITSLDANPAVKQQLDALRGSTTLSNTSGDDNALFNINAPEPEIVGINKWLNLAPNETPPTLASLKGKVVLVDFWTYTCINCIRTLPHVTSWYNKYKDQGFVVIGVHTPEFQFEHDTTNVLQAIKMYNITYPVAQDNDYATWNNFNNEYWPAEYLIDAKGVVRRTHFGEGEYDKNEMAIQALLKEAGQKVTKSIDTMPDQTPQEQQSPETYLGAQKAQYFYPNGSLTAGQQTYTLVDKPSENSFSLGGDWNITDDEAVTGKNATLSYNFTGNKVFLVLRPGSAGDNAKVKVFVDGKLATSVNAGTDVKDGTIVIDTDRLYNLVDLKGKPGNHVLKLEFQGVGIEAFAFTFG